MHWAVDRWVAAKQLSGPLAFVLAMAIAGTFVGILLGTVDFPLGTHADEAAKVFSVRTGRNPSYHPILMLQLARAANALAGLSDPQATVELGRRLAIFAGGLAVFASFLLAREVLPIPAALSATLAVAVIPLTTVHARYFKEDIFMLPFVLLALAALIRALKSPTTARGILLGAAIGLASATKYVAAITLPFALLVLLLSSANALGMRARLRFAGLVAVVAIAVFVLIELPAFWDFAQFRYAFLYELDHARRGHDVRLPVALTYGLFHLRESLLPGLGLPLLILGILGLAAPWLASSERRQPLLIIALFALLWYAVHELSPLKPYPGFARYMVPLAPLLIILGAAFVCALTQGVFGSAGGLVAAVVVLLAAGWALDRSILINGPTQDDLRAVVPATVLSSEPQTFFDSYAQFESVGRQAFLKALPTAATAKMLVTSNFAYGRVSMLGPAAHQPRAARAAAAYYDASFKLPYLEVTNGRPSYGFFNPVMRIVALEGRSEALAPIAAALRRHAPSLGIRFVNNDR